MMNSDATGAQLPLRLIVVGSGHLAWQLGEALVEAGLRCVGVWARKASAAHSLAGRLLTAPLSDDSASWPEADFVLLAVSDCAISECANRIPVRSRWIMLHSSGSGSLLQCAPHARCGVLWPMATLRRERSVDWKSTPLFVEGSDSECSHQIAELAHKISNVVVHADSALRQSYHLAAVSAANFSLFLFAETSEWLRSRGGDPRLLSPILQQIIGDFVDANNLHERQTGPAARGDKQTVERQWLEVSDRPALSALYRLFSDLIGLKHTSEK